MKPTYLLILSFKLLSVLLAYFPSLIVVMAHADHTFLILHGRHLYTHNICGVVGGRLDDGRYFCVN